MDPQGQPVVYGLAATYRLAQDIALPAGEPLSGHSWTGGEDAAFSPGT